MAARTTSGTSGLRITELAHRVDLPVDTIRYYQQRGLIDPPERSGRVAFYGDDHVRRLEEIVRLRDQGHSLRGIEHLLDGSLRSAVLEEARGSRLLTRAELAAETGVPDALLGAAEAAGLVASVGAAGDDHPRYTESDVAMVRSALAVLQAGFPLDDLLALASEHAAHVDRLAERAVEMFEDHVYQGGDDAAAAAAFQDLLPEVTRLVALHFQRTLLTRALARIDGDEARTGLVESLEAVSW